MHVYIKDLDYPEVISNGNTIRITLSDGIDDISLTGKINQSTSNNTYWFGGITVNGKYSNNNAIIFSLLGIKEKNLFVENVVGYKITLGKELNAFPEVKSPKELVMVLEALKTINTPSISDNLLRIKSIKLTKLNFKL